MGALVSCVADCVLPSEEALSQRATLNSKTVKPTSDHKGAGRRREDSRSKPQSVIPEADRCVPEYPETSLVTREDSQTAKRTLAEQLLAHRQQQRSHAGHKVVAFREVQPSLSSELQILRPVLVK